CDVGRESGFAQAERDIVAAPEMLADQRRKINIAENVSAVSDKRRIPKFALDVFDSAAGLQQQRLILKMQRHVSVAAVGKRPLVGLVAVVRVDDNFFRTVADEMIERKRDQRLLADGNQRLWFACGERAQARA